MLPVGSKFCREDNGGADGGSGENGLCPRRR